MSNIVTTSPIPGFKALMVGESGTGKTHAIRTLLDAGLEVFVLFTEPGMEVLSDIPSDKLHWHYIPPASPDWADMVDSATKINTLSFESLAKMSDIKKGKYTEFIQILTCLSNFTDERTGKSFGAVDDWNTDRVLVLDSLSGLSIAAMNLVTGSKPCKSMADWGVAQDNLGRLIDKLATSLACHFILTAHLERESNEVTGGVELMASTLGKKLAPKLPRFFSDVVHCIREGATFRWSTASMNVALKARNLPISDKIPASFVEMLGSWKKRGGVVCETVAKS